ncbi:MAG TPA: hypothetical protein DEF42_11470 [Desulfosporosinus sp.]|nr:hypothetical protein [Desulfosporosinus sp.]
MAVNNDQVLDIQFEHKFWLQVMGDHLYLILNSLSVFEKTELRKAFSLIRTLEELLQRSRLDSTPNELYSLSQYALTSIKKVRKFKLGLLHRHIEEDLNSSLSPSTLNHMISEAEEYERILSEHLQISKSLNYSALHYHLFWLPDIVNHAQQLTAALDPVETGLQKRVQDHITNIKNAYLKALELVGFLRSKPSSFPALNRFNLGVGNQVHSFLGFQKELQSMLITHHVLGTVSVLNLDHMIREETYYLYKLSQISEVEAPDINPVQPRIIQKL